MRTDVHRPAVINPDDYEFVACETIKIEYLGDVYALQASREVIRAHMARTGGTYSQHAHGGNCHVCGNANAIYTTLWYHEKTNSYIRVGSDCTEKMDQGDPALFRKITREMVRMREAVGHQRKLAKGKLHAEDVLRRAGLEQAWAVYQALPQDSGAQRQELTVCDIVGKLVKYGSISDAQQRFLVVLLDQINNRAAYEAKRKAEEDAAKPVPVTDERVTVRGTIISFKTNEFSNTLRMLVKHEDGYKLFGTVPVSMETAERGDVVEFCAKVRRSDRDDKFGFFSRPTKARKVTA